MKLIKFYITISILILSILAVETKSLKRNTNSFFSPDTPAEEEKMFLNKKLENNPNRHYLLTNSALKKLFKALGYKKPDILECLTKMNQKHKSKLLNSITTMAFTDEVSTKNQNNILKASKECPVFKNLANDLIDKNNKVKLIEVAKKISH